MLTVHLPSLVDLVQTVVHALQRRRPMEASQILMLIGKALAHTEVGREVAAIELDDVLHGLGLVRRRSDSLQSLALLGVGAAIGTGVALLLAPASGRDTRKRLSQGVERLTAQAADKLARFRDASPLETRSNHKARVGN